MKRLLYVVQATQFLEVMIVQSLYTQRNSVHPGVSECAELVRLDGTGIGLKGDFHVIPQSPELGDPVDDSPDRVWIHQARCSASEENRTDDAVWQFFCIPVHFRQVGVTPPVMVDELGDVTVEVAIGTLRLTKGPMNIDPEAAGLPVFSQKGRLPALRLPARGG